MSSALVRIGLTTLAVCALALVASETRFEGAFSDAAVGGLYVSIVLVGAGLVFRTLAGGARSLARPRCGSCGRAIPRGHIYCADHLRETVFHWQDQSGKFSLKR